jgi:hypothetical protein
MTRPSNPVPGGEEAPPVTNADLVRTFLRAQNLEHLGRIDEAISLYELGVAGAFDSAGPYDRLIALYTSQARHRDVERVAGAALEQVKTHRDKRAWYERMRAEARRAAERVPPAAPKRSR